MSLYLRLHNGRCIYKPILAQRVLWKKCPDRANVLLPFSAVQYLNVEESFLEQPFLVEKGHSWPLETGEQRLEGNSTDLSEDVLSECTPSVRRNKNDERLSDTSPLDTAWKEVDRTPTKDVARDMDHRPATAVNNGRGFNTTVRQRPTAAVP